MKKLKYHILFVILFMTIGIASVTTNIVLSGSTSLASNPDDFDVYFDYVTQNFGGVSSPGTILVIDNEKTFSFDVSLDKVDEVLMLDMYITNASKNYDADVSYTCNYDSEYILVSSSIESSDSAIIEARSRKLAILDIKLIKSYAGDGEKKVPVTCTLVATAVERNSKVEDDVFSPVRGRYSVGAEIAIGDEKFNIIRDNGDGTVSMLAKYNIGDDFKQSEVANSVPFSDSNGWEYAPGPKEIDIWEWSPYTSEIVDNYVSYLKTEYDIDVTGDLITMAQLGELGCTIPSDYAWISDANSRTCNNSDHSEWLVNGQSWWTHSAYSGTSSHIWMMIGSGNLSNDRYNNGDGVRPVITISKAALEGRLITFTIDGVSYNAEEGMYWSEWVNSSYNAGEFKVYEDEKNFHVTNKGSFYYANDNAFEDSVIINGESYVTQNLGWIN